MAALAASLTACANAALLPAGKLTPARDRITDEAVARDLAIFDSYDRRLSAAAPAPQGSQRYLASRAAEYVRLAREAYERNDRTTFVDDALTWASADIEALERGDSPALPAAPVAAQGAEGSNAAIWARANELRRQVATNPGAADVARAEVQLLRAAHVFLTGPACIDESPLLAAARLLEAATLAGAAVVVPAAATPPPVPTPRPPDPVPAVDSGAGANRANCAGPDVLRGVPSIVHFALDQSLLSAETRTVLDALVDKVGPYAGVKVVLSGHTDVRAPIPYNQSLSERRVHAVRDYLLSRGMDAGRLTIQAFGELQPLIRGSRLIDHARNRRVSITYTLCDGSQVGPIEQLNDIQLEAARRASAAAREKD